MYAARARQRAHRSRPWSSSRLGEGCRPCLQATDRLEPSRSSMRRRFRDRGACATQCRHAHRFGPAPLSSLPVSVRTYFFLGLMHRPSRARSAGECGCTYLSTHAKERREAHVGHDVRGCIPRHGGEGHAASSCASTSMTLPDYYAVLGLEARASGAEIKKAYQRASLQCHPDRYPDATPEENRAWT